ncbi:tripartite tricarboxylate transporter TctB family protein [Marinomonas primoryensis]|jgi:putative tricarboxylic transport membrane protein|uniref:Tripartite tricarboxylate transporter TctB family n=1 Tax=Marinomonas primoryensis TaxID=178399 RepID=A0A859D1P2_9GAMM|nr:tripartite tricarboxylate transporter TctB family protein [Marinomonas primoryensis]QKK82502.1 Tripartite tricarboxylate transporter TctB family [Marinomonas primoryensis]
MLYDRIFAGVFLVLSGLVAWTAYYFDVPFQYEPLGPKAFPIILSIILAACCIWMMIKPDQNTWHPTKEVLTKIVIGLVIMVLYAVLFEEAGFIISTTLVGTIFSWLFGEKPLKAFLYAFVLSLISYFLLADLMQLNVPTGLLFGDF